MIRSFTPSTTEVFNLFPGDRGRPLTDISGTLDYPQLRDARRAGGRPGDPAAGEPA